MTKSSCLTGDIRPVYCAGVEAGLTSNPEFSLVQQFLSHF